MIQIRADIVSNKRVKNNYWHCLLYAPLIAKKAKPGQFVNARLSDGLKPFLRRPFSIHNIYGGEIEILYEILGEGTNILSKKKKGEKIDIIGPLGNGFNYRQTGKPANLQTILVGGGMGTAPLLLLARELRSRDKISLIGAKSKDCVLCEKEFKNSGCDVRIATDDGSAGFHGRVTDLLKEVISHRPLVVNRMRIYACGPKPMLKEVCSISLKHNIPAQVSLEEHMSCGFGACLGCVVKIRSKKSKGKGFEYQRVCKEGPVFSAEDIIW